MKKSNPINRYSLKINKNEKVLEVGGGHCPHPRANVVVDKFVDSDYHRSDQIYLYKRQKFLQADGENLPFQNKEFDYIICNQVLEHVEDPETFLEELARVGKRGYIETPSIIGEHLHPKKSHRWIVIEIDNKLVLFDKSSFFSNKSSDFGPLFLTYLLKHSIAYKLLDKQYPQIRRVQYEWEDSIEYLINPTEEYFTKYFNPWDENLINSIIPVQSKWKDLYGLIPAFYEIAKFQVNKMFFYGKKYPLNTLKNRPS